MRRTRFAEEQIAFALRQAEAGTSVEEIRRKLGVSEPTFCRWKKRSAGTGVPEIRRLEQRAEGNKRLKVGSAAPPGRRSYPRQDHAAGRLAANRVTPSRRRSAAEPLRATCRVGERRGACRATGFHRSPQRHRRPGVTRRSSSGCGRRSWRRPGCATVTAGSLGRSGGRAGPSTPSGSTGSTARKGWRSDRRCPSASAPGAAARAGRRSGPPTRSGPWTSWRTSCSTAVHTGS